MMNRSRMKTSRIKQLQINSLLLISCLSAAGLAYADLIALDNTALQAIDGQAGVDLSLNLSINQKLDGSYDNVLCSNVGYCHIALSFNKRFVQRSSNSKGEIIYTPNSESGNKLWLVFKGVQGSINIQKLGLDGVDLSYRNNNRVEILKPSIQLSFTAAAPIQIRNFGFEALSFEQDEFISTATQEGKGVVDSDYGYLKANKYKNTEASFQDGSSSRFDQNKETGFTGIMMNGNFALNGKVMIFSCDGTHPRC